MSVEENKAILKKLIEELDKGNVDVWDELVSPNAVRHAHDGDKDFKAMKLGTIRLEKGRGELTLQATRIPASQVMDFRLMMLTRVDNEE